MNEKFVDINVTVDTTDPEQIAALSTLLTKVGEHAAKTVDSLSEVREKLKKAADNLLKQVEEHAAESKEPEPQPEKPTKPAKPAKPAKAPKEEPAPEPEPEPQPEPEPEKPATEEKTYQVEEVREKLKEKVADHREEIKNKLTELGAPNVSSLDPSKYAEFVNFLEGLE